jgi:hypothetical protein
MHYCMDIVSYLFLSHMMEFSSRTLLAETSQNYVLLVSERNIQGGGYKHV